MFIKKKIKFVINIVNIICLSFICHSNSYASIYPLSEGNIKDNPIEEFNNSLFLIQDSQLWKSDGLPNGKLESLVETKSNEFLTISFIKGVNLLYFYTNYGNIWRTDGTKEGTFKITDATQVNASFAAIDDNLFFIKEELQGNIRQFGLWKTDGSINNTVKINDLPYKECKLKNIKNNIYISCHNSTENILDVWVSDGNKTKLIKSIDAGKKILLLV